MLLEKDHVGITAIAHEILHSRSYVRGHRARLVTDLADEIESHFEAEEDSLFVVLGHDQRLRDLVFNLTAEHKNLEDELARLSRARNIDTIEWASRFEDFTHLLERHFRRKESELFPRAEALLNSRELSWALHEFISEKGDEIRERRRNLGIGAKTIWSGAAALAVLGLVLAARRSRFARRP